MAGHDCLGRAVSSKAPCSIPVQTLVHFALLVPLIARCHRFACCSSHAGKRFDQRRTGVDRKQTERSTRSPVQLISGTGVDRLVRSRRLSALALLYFCFSNGAHHTAIRRRPRCSHSPHCGHRADPRSAGMSRPSGWRNNASRNRFSYDDHMEEAEELRHEQEVSGSLHISIAMV